MFSQVAPVHVTSVAATFHATSDRKVVPDHRPWLSTARLFLVCRAYDTIVRARTTAHMGAHISFAF